MGRFDFLRQIRIYKTVEKKEIPAGTFLLFILVCAVLASGLRFLNLSGKPLWTDEFGTLGLAQGRGFTKVPVNEIIDYERLIDPMRGGSSAGFWDTIAMVMAEDVHPPLHFALLSLWLKALAPDENKIVSPWQMRSLGAAMSLVAVLAMAWLAWLTFNSFWAALAGAWFTAVSPFSVYLFQETRMYYLAVIWTALSLAFFLMTLRRIQAGQPPPVWLYAIWMSANALGLATHYFHLLTLLAQAASLIVIAVLDQRAQRPWSGAIRLRMMIYTLITLMALIPLAQMLLTLPDHEMAQWLVRNDSDWRTLINPIVESLAVLITFFLLLPVQNVPSGIPALSFLVVFPIFIWMILFFRRAYLRSDVSDSRKRTAFWLLLILAFSLLLLLGITYLTSRNLTAALRYGFFFFPVSILLASGAVASWLETSAMPIRALSTRIVLMAIMGLLGGLTVALDFGYSKTQQPDIVARLIHSDSQSPILVAVGHRHTWCQIAELQSLAWSLEKDKNDAKSDRPAQYLVVSGVKDDPPDFWELEKILGKMAEPLDFWALNFNTRQNALSKRMTKLGFRKMEPATNRADGYSIMHFRRF